jgi:ubiquinone/menaquinone biosynthesis C-methylase UbiE
MTVIERDMSSAEISRLRDEYARRHEELHESYKYSLFNPAALFAYQERQMWIMKILGKYGFFPLKGADILEVGCGSGGVLAEFLSYGVTPSRLYGLEVVNESVQMAHNRLPHLPVIYGDGQTLPFPDGKFKLVMQYTAFSSILDEKVRTQMAREMQRVVDPQNGIILSYDFWINPLNRQTIGIRPSELRRLFPNCSYEFHRITLAPPVAARLIKVSRLLCSFLERLKVFNTHYLTVIRPIKV